MPPASYADMQRSLTEALEQQTATSEILRVISQSPTDIQPVLDAVTANTAAVCGATDALIMRVEGQDLRRVAHFGLFRWFCHGAGADSVPEVCRAARRSDMGDERGGCGFDVYVHDSGAPRGMTAKPSRVAETTQGEVSVRTR
jgi:hypothetical protein